MNAGTFLYSILFLLSILGITFAYWKVRNRIVLLFYLCLSGITLFFDYLIYVFGKAYTYHPGFISGKFDTHLGALINANILPAGAILYFIFQFGWTASLVLALLLTGIEVLFTYLDIFDPKWWSPWFTLSILSLYFPASMKFFVHLQKSTGKVLPIISLIAAEYALRIQLAVLIYGVFKSRSYHVPWLENLHVNSSAINSIITLFVGVTFVVPVYFNLKMRWYATVIIVSILTDLLLKRSGIIQTHSPWDSIFYVAADLLSLVMVAYLRKALKRSLSKANTV